MFRFSSFSRVRFADINFYMVSSKGSPALPGFFRPQGAGREGREASRPSRRATETAAPGKAGEGRARGTRTPGKRRPLPWIHARRGHRREAQKPPHRAKARTTGESKGRGGGTPRGRGQGTGAGPAAASNRGGGGARSTAQSTEESTEEQHKLYKIIFCIVEFSTIQNRPVILYS